MDETRVASPSLSSTSVRELGAAEQFFWWMNRNRCNHFAMAIEIAGTTTAKQWRGALDELQKRHPLLSVAIQAGDNDRPAFVAAPEIPLPLRLVPDGDPQEWHREMERELGLRFDGTHAPLLRAVLLQRADRAVLLLTAHHSISDGLSMTFLIRDLMTALSGRSLQSLPVPPSSESLIDQLPGEPSSAAPAQAPPPPPKPLEYAAAGAQPCIAHACFDAEATAALRERARSEGTTLNSALCAAAVLAGRAEYAAWRDKPVRVATPVSYRQVEGAGEANGLYIGSGRMSFAPDPAIAFWELARSAKAQTADAVSVQSAKAFALRLNKAVEGIRDAETAAGLAAVFFSSETIVTNLGKLPYATEFGTLKLEAVWGPALFMGFADLPTLGAVTTNGCLRLILVKDIPAPALLSRIEHFLLEACGQPHSAAR